MLNAVEYLREKSRMTNGCKEYCSKCQLSSRYNGCDVSCGTFQTKYPEKAVEIVEKWSKEHPVKTYLDDFLEKYPNAPLEIDGTPKCCPTDMYRSAKECELGSCMECWKQPLEE